VGRSLAVIELLRPSRAEQSSATDDLFGYLASFVFQSEGLVDYAMIARK